PSQERRCRCASRAAGASAARTRGGTRARLERRPGRRPAPHRLGVPLGAAAPGGAGARTRRGRRCAVARSAFGSGPAVRRQTAHNRECQVARRRQARRGRATAPARARPRAESAPRRCRPALVWGPSPARSLAPPAPLAARTPAALTAAASEPEREAGALDPAFAAGWIELESQRIRLTHPLLAAAVVSGIRPQRRQQLHARLAQIVSDPEERARHLALATEGAEAEIAESLEQAAERAARRGAPAVAAELAELASQRTPTTDHDARWRRLIEAGLRYATAGDLARARALLEPLTNEIPPGPRRAEVLLNLA